MCRFRALSTPTMANTINTPANIQRKDRFVSAERISEKVFFKTDSADSLSLLTRLAGR